MMKNRTHTTFLLALVSAIACMQAYVGSTDTFALYHDVETSTENYLRADPVDFSVNLGGSREIVLQDGGTKSITPIVSLEPDSHPIEYRVVVSKVSGDDALCAGLQVYTTQPLIYSGALLALSTGTTNEIGPWTLNVSTEGGYTDGAQCEVRLLYTGWEVGFAEGEGYMDEEEIVLLVTYDAPAPVQSAVVEPVSLVEEISDIQEEEIVAETPVEEKKEEAPQIEEFVEESEETPAQE